MKIQKKRISNITIRKQVAGQEEFNRAKKNIDFLMAAYPENKVGDVKDKKDLNQKAE